MTAGATSPYLKRGVGFALMDEAAPAEGTQVSIVCIDGESHTGTLHTVPLHDKEALIPRGKLADIPEWD